MVRITKLEKKQTACVIILTCFLFSLTGLWAIDVSVGCMLMGKTCEMTNGYWVRTPVQHYHIGLWLVGISIWLSTTVFIVYLLDKGGD